jgi:large subunit ribosomal protein L10
MPSQEKIDWVNQLEDTVSEAPDMVFTSFKGLTVEELEDLRVELYENDATYKVVKNRLAKRAFKEVFDEAPSENGDASASDESDADSETEAELGDIDGVGPSKVEAMEEAGIESVADVLSADLDELTEVSGIGESTAEKIKDSAGELDVTVEQTEDDSDEGTSAADALDLDEIDEFLRGNTGIAFSGNGFVNTAQVVTEFSEEHEDLEIKGGILEGSILDEDNIEEISELPTRRELLTQLASSLNSPIQALASFLNYPIQSLVNSLEQIKDQKDE